MNFWLNRSKGFYERGFIEKEKYKMITKREEKKESLSLYEKKKRINMDRKLENSVQSL